MNDENVCNVCQRKELDTNKLLTCLYCFSCAHFKCKKIIGNACRRVRDNPYFCTPDCVSIYQRIIEMSNSKQALNTTLMNELKLTIENAVSTEMLKVKSEVEQITTAIETSQEFLSAKFDAISIDFNKLKQENEELKLEISILERSQSALTEMVYKLEQSADKTSRAINENNAIFMGVPTTQNENTTQLIVKTIQCLGVKLQSASILSATRLNARKNNNAIIPIKVVFQHLADKEALFEKKKRRGKLLSTEIDSSLLWNGRPTTVSIRDELSPLSSELFRELRDSQELLNIKYIWPGRHGVILIRKNDGDRPEIVKNREDLSKMMTKYLNATNTPSPKRKRLDKNVH